MTAELVREAHDRLEEQVARGLVAEGYEVFVAPGAHVLPRELVGLRPDILARRGGENLLVEVKLVPTAGGAEQAKRMAQAVESRPGCRVPPGLGGQARDGATTRALVAVEPCRRR